MKLVKYMKLIKNIRTVMILTILVLSSSIVKIIAADLPSGLSAEQLEQTIEAYVEKHKDTTAAVSIGVFTKDSVLFEKSYGYANIEENAPNNADTVFEWGSSTKLFVWVSIMQLVEEGKLDLNEDIRTYLPKEFLTKLKYDDKITLTHLMNHTGGWQESLTELFVDSPDKLRTLEDSLKVLEPAQIYRPGEVTAYSNFGAALAGYIVECISDEPFYEYVNKNIFVPLGMKHTSIKPDRTDNSWVQSQRQKLNSYSVDNKPIGKADYYMGCYPAGGAIGTISDFLTFGQALFSDSNSGTVLFNKPETLEEFHTPTSYYPDGTPRILHGMYTTPSLMGNGTGHAGKTDGCSSNLILDLERGFGVVVMTNQQQEKVYNSGLMEKIFGRVEIKHDESLPDSAPVVGIYKSSRNYETGIQKILKISNYWTVSKNKDGSTSINNSGASMSFEQVGPGVFLVSSGSSSMLWYADYDVDGEVKAINASALDLVRTSFTEYAIDILLFVLLIAAALYSFVYMIIAVIQRIRKKKSPLRAWRMTLCGSTLLTMVNLFIYLINTGSFSSTSTPITINGIFFILLGLVPVVYAIILVTKWKSLDLSKKQKIGVVTSGVMGLLVTLNLFYWQLWMFWI